MLFHGTPRDCPWAYYLKARHEVDKAKVELIIKLPSVTTVKGVRQFLGHVRSYSWAKRRWKALCDLLWSFIVIFTNHSALKYQLTKLDAKAKLIILASRVQSSDQGQEMSRECEAAPWYAHIANYLVTGEVPSEWKAQDKKLCSKWVEVIPCKTNDHRVVLKFLKENIFSRFRVPKAIISDGGTHFCNKSFETLLAKYGVKHKVSTPYHPQTSGQVELANQEIKNILMKVVNMNRRDWSVKLHNSLWAYRITYKTILGMSPYRLVYGKACHLPVEVEYKAWWAIKKLNMDLSKAGMKRFLDLNEMEELRNDAYNNSNIAKQRLKRWHDQKVEVKVDRSFTIQQVHSNGVVNYSIPTAPGVLKSMVIILNHSWSLFLETKRKSSSLSHIKLNKTNVSINLFSIGRPVANHSKRQPTPLTPFRTWRTLEEAIPTLHCLAHHGQEPPLRGIRHLKPPRPRPFHLLRVECPLTLLSANTRHKDHRFLHPLRAQHAALQLRGSEPQDLRPGESLSMHSLILKPQPILSVLSGISPEAIIKSPMVTVPPIEGNSDCRARPFHSKLCFDLKAAPGVLPPFTSNIDGRQGILEVRHIAEALHIPYELVIQHIFGSGSYISTGHGPHPIQETSGDSILLCKELPPGMLLWFIGRSYREPTLFHCCFEATLSHIGAHGLLTEPHLERHHHCRDHFTLDKWTQLAGYSAPLGALPRPAPPMPPQAKHAQQDELPTESVPPAPAPPMPEATSTTPSTTLPVPPAAPSTSKASIIISGTDFVLWYIYSKH
ncbi:Gag-Pol polyprotein [Vitis vinifera]|uniref:Gag-Pol polyprotein n=1 Tax=Vitis vinifera TaxID=29760 RepID=A0A438CW12_VITVI|nr:Gag-Pol polyprotein [Vitis vinifera]